ncbi:ribonuclease HII [Aerococcus kribbianus]|uniref:Ribonuclease HII n=1 Tax=Aerococcus kribbianus TaxID=2999064 RepID=A0A9X3JCT2_9LACT|nr:MULTISPECIES: ribonuclease HII [unclassified Aerococcus]MCZ0716795.1 ribonuclease HII [Aerococcus sp. YH-aer221]MCZ0725083.1 ribonuclease HII [Aerococcus sp. YH-aer222]
MINKKPATIADIKAYLKQDLSLIDPTYVKALAQDDRKGVASALAAYHKRCEKEAAILQAIDQLKARERQLRQAGYQFIAGVDEVGRGPLAGPVVAGAVILPEDMPAVYFNDSKQLSHQKRMALVADIEKYAIAYAVAGQSAQVIDQVNILQASKQAMALAIDKLTPQPDYLLVDAVALDQVSIPQSHPIKGDATVYAIAAASIYAKEKRDALMRQYDDQFPGYGFGRNAGYGTKDHLAALEKGGPTPIHRRTFAPVKKYL